MFVGIITFFDESQEIVKINVKDEELAQEKLNKYINKLNSGIPDWADKYEGFLYDMNKIKDITLD